MKQSITVIGVEADGIRGLRLEESKAEWVVADSEFWPTSGTDASDAGDEASGAAEGGAPASAAAPDADGRSSDSSPEDRYAATVEALKEAAKRFGTSEVVLSMPLKSLLVKVSRTLVDDRDRLSETADEELGKVSPFPDETPVTGIETVAETDRELVTVFAALPSAEAGEIGDALDEAKVRVIRTDITALGWLRTLWPQIFGGTGNGERGTEPSQPASAEGYGAASPQLSPPNPQPPASDRKVVLMDLDNGWDVIVINDGSLSLLRGLGRISDPAEMEREVMLSLLRADRGGRDGSHPSAGGDVGEIVVFSQGEVEPALVESLSQLAPVRSVALEGDGERGTGNGEPGTGNGEPPTTNCQLPTLFGGIEGVARRTQEGASLDVTPADWTELRTEARFKKKLMVFLAAAAAGWMLLMGVLFGVPFVYGQMTERQKTLSKRHAKAYGEVKEMRDKVKLVQQYSDHARGSLEMLKAVSDRMPEGITLTSFSYRRGERVSIACEASQPTDVYEFKNALTEAATEDESKPFTDVILTGPSQSRGVHKFSIEGSFEEKEEGK